MRAYVIRRLLLVIPTLFVMSLIVFFSVRFIPGDAIDAMLGRADFLVDVDREALARMLGLDVPAYVQYGRWIGDIFLHGSLGHSLIGGRAPVEEKIFGRLPVTLQLGMMSIVIGLLIALPIGIYSAIRQDTAADYVGRSVAIIGLATPNFWAGNHGHDLPGDLVGLVASDRSDSVDGKSAGESGGVHPSQPDSGYLPVRGDHADNAHHDAGGAAAGLHPDGPGPRASRRGWSSCATAVKKCPHSDRDPGGPAATDPGRGLRYHGEHLQPAGIGFVSC